MEEIVDVEMAPPTQTVDVKAVVQKWMEKLNQGVLSNRHFKDYWRTWVPHYYSPKKGDNYLNFNFRDDDAIRVLFNPLEKFICNGDPKTVLQQLSALDKPPSVCGKVFKMGEPTYSCRECGMDTTCVLCVDCFKKSEHRHHKYKMGTSTGGGCCDCGDTEAWKCGAFCDIHIVGTKEQDKSGSALPEDISERTRIVFSAVLWYAYTLLSLENCADLGPKDTEDELFDVYCTVLYNDECHTFEQVISTLSRVLKCSQRTAIEYVTNIDREGRAVVKCAGFTHCSELKQEIEIYTSRRSSKALRVSVLHAHVVAHQIFAMKLLFWLQAFLGHGEGFRGVFCEIVLKPQPSEPCMITGVLLHDSQLWKSARTHWHRLIISGMLLEYESKKTFAQIFTKNYGVIMKDFIRDDHEHMFSVTSLSVQIFTVPTLVHHLIAHNDALFILLNTFISECTRKCNKAGRLEFERNVPIQTFKRAQYMLFDLRYMLSVIPRTWTDELRREFLHGLTEMFKLLTMMQGVDATVRQVGQHLEYEPDWEIAFNLHIKLATCISSSLQWCGTDKVVLVKAYRAILKKLHENPCYDPSEAGEVRELADHSVACLQYDVSSKPVSIHIPLSRFLAGLHLYLDDFGLNFDSPTFQIDKPTPVQIIEPVLRAQVLIAQVHAGMWRRNGYGLLNQLYFYHNVKCRTEMFDRDMNLLQVGASLIESNEFLVHLLNKFNLIRWASSTYEMMCLSNPDEDSIRQTVTLVEEFLQLLIVIVGERYTCGIGDVTREDIIKKEIIQHLCIKPMLHSELNKIIPDDVANDMSIDDSLRDLATFRKPTKGQGQGVYELREQFYEDYNVFFYHYTREEFSKAEETQRKRTKNVRGLECCPPPKLPKLKESFSMLVNLLQCDVMLHIMSTVLTRCLNLRARSFSELQLHEVLHLIGYALHEEESGHYPFLIFSEKALKWKLPSLLEELRSSPRIDAHRDLIKWTVDKFNRVCKVGEPAQNVPSTSTSTAPVPDNEKERRAKLAATRRAKVMAQMAAMQNSFVRENAKLFQETNLEVSEKCDISPECNMDVTEYECDKNPVALGRDKTCRQNVEKTFVCILCQEEQKVSIEGPPLVLAAFVQQATVLCQHRNCDGFTDFAGQDPLYLNSNLGPAPHTSTCGHVMHSACWQKYFENVVQKEHRSPYRLYRLHSPSSFDVDKLEFLCPLCECLSNTILPLLPPLGSLQSKPPENPISFRDWLACISLTVREKVPLCHGSLMCTASPSEFHRDGCEVVGAMNSDSEECGLDCDVSSHQLLAGKSLDEIAPHLGDRAGDFKKLFPMTCPKMNASLVEMVQLYAQATYTRGLNVNHHPTNQRVPPMAWKSCAYTIHAVEVLLRDAEKPLLGHLSSRQRDCLETLVRVMALLGATLPESAIIGSHALMLLSYILENPHEGPSVLQWDSLGFLISLTYSLPSLFCRSKAAAVVTCGMLELHTLHLVMVCHMTKILITMDTGDTINFMDVDGAEDETLVTVLKLVNKYKDGMDTGTVWTYVQDACLPFLRCCVLFYHYLSNVAAPQDLLEVKGDTFHSMCRYLGLPTTTHDLFDLKSTSNVIASWASHPEVASYVAGTPMLVGIEPLPVNRLVELPNDYSELINTVSSFVCPNSDHDDSRNPTMCLVCGEILCSQSYCCQTEVNKAVVGACNFHAYKCGAGVGIFLRVRDCEILFLASPHHGCNLSPPYLDDYGETDQGLKRGNPLRLCPALYKKLQTTWLSHSVHEEIARSIESNRSTAVQTQWQHL